jgi:hypothetical protein
MAQAVSRASCGVPVGSPMHSLADRSNSSSRPEYQELGGLGDFHRGPLNAVRRKCGKPNCACAAPEHPGHGPQWNLTRTAGGRTRAVHVKSGPELEKARREVAEYERFRDLVGQVTEVNEAICQARPAAIPLPGWEEKKGAPGGPRGGVGRRARTAGRPRGTHSLFSQRITHAAGSWRVSAQVPRCVLFLLEPENVVRLHLAPPVLMPYGLAR